MKKTLNIRLVILIKFIEGLIVNPVTLIDSPSESLLPLVTPKGLGIIFFGNSILQTYLAISPHITKIVSLKILF